MWEFLSKYTGLPISTVQSRITVECGALGNFSFPKWEIECKQPPTQKQIEKALSAPPEISQVQALLKAQIDSQAELERLKYITPGVGQSMTYQEKVNQAANYSGLYTAHLADPDNNLKPNDNEYLLLKAGLGIDGNTVLQVAETITFAYLQWQQLGAAIEAVRLRTKASIDAAETAQEAQSIFDVAI